jgi:hypothetical protein
VLAVAGADEPPRWTRLRPAHEPPARIYASAAFDGRRGVVVLFGGGATGRAFGDTWEWNGRDWRERKLTPAPAPRYGAAMAWDAARGEVVLYGGSGAASCFDTWTYDGVKWRQRATSLGANTSSGTATFDARRKEVVMVTRDHDGKLSTWRWSGERWSEAKPAHPLPIGHADGLAFDARRGTVVLLGAACAYECANRLFDWDGSDWHERSVEMPAGLRRSDCGLVYDAKREMLLLAGGEGRGDEAVDDAWALHDATWRRDPGFGARKGHAMAYDGQRGVVVSFGGGDATVLDPFTDTLELR